MTALLLRAPQAGDTILTPLSAGQAPLGWREAPPCGAAGRHYQPLLQLGEGLAAGPFLYTVEADVDPVREEELNAWYDTEHLPRLAAVPGVLGAARFRLLQGEAPRYLAAYRLTAPAVFEGPDWLRARTTPWTARARLFFRHPRRIMWSMEAP